MHSTVLVPLLRVGPEVFVVNCLHPFWMSIISAFDALLLMLSDWKVLEQG